MRADSGNWPAGKYEHPALAVSPTGAALAWLHGYVGADQVQRAWLDRRPSGAAAWTSSAATLVTDAAAASADAFTFTGPDTVVGYGGGQGLWVSRNGGADWRERLAHLSVIAVAARERTVWILASRCSTEDACRPTLIRSGEGRSRFTVANRQPPTTGRALGLFALSGGRQAIPEITDSGATRLLVNADGTHRWHEFAAPCPARRNPAFAAAPSMIWLTCLQQGTGPAPGEGGYATYRSADGQRWEHTVAAGAPPHHLVATPVSARAAWGIADGQGLPVTLLRTVDGGKHWRPVRSWSNGTAGDLIVAPSTARTADVIVESFHPGRSRFSVYRTTDAGTSWSAATLPAPANLQSRH